MVTNRHTDRYTDDNRDSMTESAQGADSVKNKDFFGIPTLK